MKLRYRYKYYLVLAAVALYLCATLTLRYSFSGLSESDFVGGNKPASSSLIGESNGAGNKPKLIKNETFFLEEESVPEEQQFETPSQKVLMSTVAKQEESHEENERRNASTTTTTVSFKNFMREPLQPQDVIPVLVLVCNRPSVKRSIDSLLKYRSSAEKFPIVVSQDCGADSKVEQVLEDYGLEAGIKHIMQPDLSDIEVSFRERQQSMVGYYKIARHYGFALDYIFNQANYSNVIIVEDDLEVAPDFFEYFAATLPILRRDPTLWCVSAWNDNGKSGLINGSAPELLYRTDFFPGLGWMLTKDLWTELKDKWPRGYWDDWLREPSQRKGRACIRPEISRTWTFGQEGVSKGFYFKQHLKFIKLNTAFVPFTQRDLSYLLKENYDSQFLQQVYSSEALSSVMELRNSPIKVDGTSKAFLITYNSLQEFKRIAFSLNIMGDEKAGVPRTAYQGIVSFMSNGNRVYLVPGAHWTGY